MLVTSHTYAGRWIGAYGRQAEREYAELRTLAGALRAMVGRYMKARQRL